MRTIAILKKCNKSDREQIEKHAQGKFDVCYFDSEDEMTDSPDKDNIEIIFGEPKVDYVNQLPNVRFIQMTWAGANLYTCENKLRDGIRLANASGCFGGIISEYIVGGLTSLYRKFYDYREIVKADGWKRADGEATLKAKRALILGMGDIGINTAKKLKAFDAVTVGIRRKSAGEVQYFDEAYTIESLDTELAKADIVIITLPGTDETYRLFDKERIAKIKKGADFVNVGRGFIADADALAEAFLSGHLHYGVIDVTDPEPLPKGHPLRNMANVLLTPHISGISWDENMYTKRYILDVFCVNLDIVINGNMEYNNLMNEVDFSLGY